MTLSKQESPIIHKSVLVAEVLAYLDPQPGKIYLDVTFGSGGHTRAILDKQPQCRVIALDWDESSLNTYVPDMQEQYGDRFIPLWGNFAHLYKILKKAKISGVDGILADFGTSHMQIFGKDGFSLYRDALLDMRMSPAHQRFTAADVVNEYSEKKLQDIFWQLGEERYSKRIARAIVQERQKKPIERTGQLTTLIEWIVPMHKGMRIHPATRVFQALRIYINKELDNIIAFLPAALSVLHCDGRLVCISFHSLEDRLVKQFFREKEDAGSARVLTRKAICASEQELLSNPSARSAKLRAAERVCT